MEKVKKRAIQIKIGDNKYKLSDVGTRKNKIFEEWKNVEYNYLEDMVFRMELTYSEIEKVVDIEYVNTSTIGYTSPPGVCNFSDITLLLKISPPDEVKMNITIDDIRLKSNLITNKTIRFTKKSIIYTILGFVASHSGVSGDIPGFVKLIPGSYRSDKPVNITGIDKIHI